MLSAIVRMPYIWIWPSALSFQGSQKKDRQYMWTVFYKLVCPWTPLGKGCSIIIQYVLAGLYLYIFSFMPNNLPCIVALFVPFIYRSTMKLKQISLHHQTTVCLIHVGLLKSWVMQTNLHCSAKANLIYQIKSNADTSKERVQFS